MNTGPRSSAAAGSAGGIARDRASSRRRRPRRPPALAPMLSLLLTMALPQAPVAAGPAEQLVATFRGLPEEKRHEAWRHVERRVQREEDPTVVRIFGRQKGLAAYPPLSAPVWHKSEDFAPHAAPPGQPGAAGRARAPPPPPPRPPPASHRPAAPPPPAPPPKKPVAEDGEQYKAIRK